ncbi:MAG: cytochrome c oxidase subunit [Verrucomicrobiota bacterium]|jgi:cytochrome c oxidase subunit 4
MSASHSIEAIKKHRRTYLTVFLCLLVGTALTVGMYYVHFQHLSTTVTIALIVATVKASLVAAFFMHLSHERKAIYSTLLVTACFLAAMMWLFIHTRTDVPLDTEFPATKYVPHSSTPAKP